MGGSCLAWSLTLQELWQSISCEGEQVPWALRPTSTVLVTVRMMLSLNCPALAAAKCLESTAQQSTAVLTARQ